MNIKHCRIYSQIIIKSRPDLSLHVPSFEFWSLAFIFSKAISEAKLLGSDNYWTGWRTKTLQDKQIISSCPLKWKVKVAQSCLTLCDPMDCSLPGSSVHEVLQARILEWVAVPFCRGSFQLRTQVSRTAGEFFTIWATREDLLHLKSCIKSRYDSESCLSKCYSDKGELYRPLELRDWWCLLWK